MKVNIISPIHPGGPYYTGKNLAEALNRKGVAATWTHRLNEVLASPLRQTANVVHSQDIPIVYRLWKKPLVLSVKGEYTIEKSIWQRLYPRAIEKADIITVPSYFLKERLNLQDAIVIPNAIFPERFEQVRHSEKDIINLVTITDFHFEDKARGILDILEILNAAKRIATKRIKYLVVGGGPYLGQIMRQTKIYDIDMEFTDVLQNPKKILENSDIFIYYSHHDSFGIALLEAMACGLPVVTNEFGAASEIIEDGKDGYIARTSEAYSEYLLSLVNSPELRSKVGEKARRSIEAKFDWAKIVDKYIEIYKALL